ncbi:hypothetical protein ACLESD_14745 [Pyxidicoccus sp. 3LFB2]
MRQRGAVGPWHFVLASLFLSACASTGRRTAPGYAQRMDSATSACRQNPIYCKTVAGEETVVPLATGAQTARAGASLAGALKLFEDEQRERVEQLLKNCVEQASAEVNLQRFGANPTLAQCAEQVGVDSKGKPVTRAMTLGTEKHEAALRCIAEALGKERPGGFSLEQRYRYDPRTKETTLLSEEQAQTLLRQGRGDELRGTIRPDVVIHDGNPLRAHAVYDLKFPCPGSNYPKWPDYPPKHPYAGIKQGAVYDKALGVEPARVAPSWGVVR